MCRCVSTLWLLLVCVWARAFAAWLGCSWVCNAKADLATNIKPLLGFESNDVDDGDGNDVGEEGWKRLKRAAEMQRIYTQNDGQKPMTERWWWANRQSIRSVLDEMFTFIGVAWIQWIRRSRGVANTWKFVDLLILIMILMLIEFRFYRIEYSARTHGYHFQSMILSRSSNLAANKFM